MLLTKHVLWFFPSNIRMSCSHTGQLLSSKLWRSLQHTDAQVAAAPHGVATISNTSREVHTDTLEAHKSTTQPNLVAICQEMLQPHLSSSLPLSACLPRDSNSCQRQIRITTNSENIRRVFSPTKF